MQIYHNELPDLDLAALWRRLDDWGSEPPPPTTVLRQGNTRRVYLTEVAPGCLAVAKCWFRSHGLLRLKRQSLLHSGHNEAAATALAHARGVGPYRPLAFAERRWLWRRQQLLLLPFLGDRVTVDALIQEGRLGRTALTALVHAFGGCLGRIHGQGLIHNDFKLDNALVMPAAAEPAKTMAIIDWGKAWQPARRQRQWQMEELVAACCSLARAGLASECRQALLAGYAEQMQWPAGEKQDAADTVETSLARALRQSNRRVWANATRKARRLTVGERDGWQFFLRRGISPDAALAACRGEAGELATSESQATATWRAANVLWKMGMADDTVVGLVREKSWFGRGRAWLVYRAGGQAPDAAGILAQAKRYL